MCMSIGFVIENGFLALRPPSGGSKPGASMGLQARPDRSIMAHSIA